MKKMFTLCVAVLLLASVLRAQNVGIGTAAPPIKLSVKQDVPNKAILWQHETKDDAWSVGIGTFSLNCRFEFNGALRGQISSVDGAYISSSDLRYKEDILPFTSVLSKTLQLKPSSYFFKESRAFAQHKSVGFIAQEVEKLFPELVYNIDGGYKGINYAGFSVIAIKAVQEQQEKITALENRLFRLENRLNEMADTQALANRKQ